MSTYKLESIHLLLISTVVSKQKDFSRLQAVTYTKKLGYRRNNVRRAHFCGESQPCA